MRIFGFILITALACCAVSAHKRGEEFSYLSMFLERDDSNSGLDLDSLYRTYAKSSYSSDNSSKRRKLQHADKTKSIKPPKSTPTPTPIYDDNPEQNEYETKENNAFEMNSDASNPKINEDIGMEETESNKKLSISIDEEAMQLKTTTTAMKKTTTEETSDEDSAEMLGIRHGEDVDRLSEMIVKLIKQYSIKSMMDVPCRAHTHWMYKVLEELPSLKYICVDTNVQVLASIKDKLTEKNVQDGARFIVRKFWQDHLPRADLIVSWFGLDNMNFDHVHSYFQLISKHNHLYKLFAVGSHTGELEKKGDTEKIARFTSYGVPINVRRQPFSLSKPARIIKKLSIDGNDKQLYIYFPDKLYASTSAFSSNN